MKEAVLDELRRHFRPEFLNRVDETIVFHALDEQHLKEIAVVQLERLQQRLAEMHMGLELTAGAKTRTWCGSDTIPRSEPGHSSGRSSERSRIRWAG